MKGIYKKIIQHRTIIPQQAPRVKSGTSMKSQQRSTVKCRTTMKPQQKNQRWSVWSQRDQNIDERWTRGTSTKIYGPPVKWVPQGNLNNCQRWITTTANNETWTLNEIRKTINGETWDIKENTKANGESCDLNVTSTSKTNGYTWGLSENATISKSNPRINAKQSYT